MSDNTQAPEAPASAVEATSGEPNPTTQQAPEGPSTEAAQADASAPADTQDGEGAEHEGDDEGPEEGEAAAEGQEAGADGQRKKRRRRRKKKGAKPGEGQVEGQAAAEGGNPEQPQRPRGEKPAREGQGGVFARFFEAGHANKRHAFAAGEVVAGRVASANEGAFTVDLFGKATAFVDIFEPHEVPALPEPKPEPEKPVVEGADPAAAIEGVEGAQLVSLESVAEPAEVLPNSAESGATPSEDAPSVEGAGVSDTGAAQTAPSEEASSVEGTGVEDTGVADAGAAQAAEDAHAAASADEHEHKSEGEGHEEHEEVHHEEAEPEPEAPPAPERGTIFRGRIGSVSESGHVVLVNRIVDVGAAKKRIVDAREKRRRVRGLVYGFNRGGFDVLVEGIRVFCPASGMSLGPVGDPHELLGQRLEFTVPPAKAGTHGLVVSRRGILERQQRKAAKQLFRSLAPGQRLKGRVTQIRDFGIFVDLGGIEGLVHQSELSFNRGVRPVDAAQVGDEVDVQVLRVGEGQTRRERERVSLSMKSLQADPWGSHVDTLEPGAVVNGKVVRTTEFGAFIELAPQVEGLLHISEIGRELKHANQALQEGQELRVVVERVDRKARRISLSKLSGAEEKAIDAGTDAKSARPPKPGQQLTVTVEKVEQAGLLVQVPGVFGKRGRGFIPNAEMGTERGTDHRKGFPPGTQVPVKVVGVDRDGGFRFSRKAVVVDEEKRAIQDYRREAARQGLGTFGDLLRKKLEGGGKS